MKIEYDKTVQCVYFNLIDSEVYESEEINPGIIYDYDKNDNVVGIEILFLKHRTPEEVKRINFPFSEEDRSMLRQFFSNVLA